MDDVREPLPPPYDRVHAALTARKAGLEAAELEARLLAEREATQHGDP